MDSETNFKISFLAASTSEEEILQKIEEGVKTYRETKDPKPLGFATYLWHVKKATENKFNGDPFKFFQELEKLERQKNLFQPQPQ